MTETKTPNLAAKSALARLMAAENITVNVDGKAPTAMFDVENRVLTLPLWEVDGEAYDMLVGHEVSHALHTPAGATSLFAACDAIDPKNRAVAKDYLNVVEDARIERLIKLDYPGLRRAFATGYREFMKRDLFKVNGKLNQLASMPLIDRVNLHYKIGWLVNVPFTDAELPLVRRVAETRSWDEVVALSKELYDLAKKQESENKDKNPDQNQDGEGEQGDESETSEGEESAETESGSGENNETESGSDEGDGQQGEKSDDGESGDSVGEGTAEGEANEDDGSTAEGKDGTSTSRTGSNDAADGKTNDSNDAPSASETMRNLEKGLSDLVKVSKATYVYADVPEVPNNFVVPVSVIEAELSKSPDAITVADLTYASWKANNTPNVQSLATEFERRKAADAHKRTLLSDTGSIDPDRLHAYRTSDDIFLRSSTLRDGKNHGIVLLLDMSGSMSHIMHDTMVQLVNLVAFARRVNIPYKVYGFVDSVPAYWRDKKVDWVAKKGSWNSLVSSMGTDNSNVRLLTLFESGMSQQRFQRQAGHLLAWTGHMGHNRGKNTSPIRKDWVKGNGHRIAYSYYADAGLKLNGTPLNVALLSMLTLVPKFQKEKNLQVVNTIVLTDGEASDTPLAGHNFQNREVEDHWKAKNPLVTLRDPVTRREYPCFEKSKTENTYYGGHNGEQQTEVICAALRDRTGAKVICIDLVAGARDATYRIERALKGTSLTNARFKRAVAAGRATKQDLDVGSQIDALKRFFSKNGYAVLPNADGYDVRIVLDGTAEEIDDTFDNLTVNADSKAGQRELQKAFQKSLQARKSNRPLMEKIADLIAKGL